MGCNNTKILKNNDDDVIVESPSDHVSTTTMKKNNSIMVDKTMTDDSFLNKLNKCLEDTTIIKDDLTEIEEMKDDIYIEKSYTNNGTILDNEKDFQEENEDKINENDIKLHLDVSLLNKQIINEHNNKLMHNNNDTPEKNEDDHDVNTTIDTNMNRMISIEMPSSPPLDNTFSHDDIIDNLNLSEIKKINKQASFDTSIMNNNNNNNNDSCPNESQISVVEVEDHIDEEEEEKEQQEKVDIIEQEINVKKIIEKQNFKQIETNHEYQKMTTRHIPIVMNTNRGLSLSDIRPLASSSSSLTTASSSCNLQQHTVNVNPTITTNSTNIDGITYPHNRQGIEALLDSTIQSARKIQKRAERYLSKSNSSNLNHSILNIDLNDNKEEEEKKIDYNHTLNNNVNFISNNSNNSSFRIYMKKTKRSKGKDDEVFNLRVLSDNVDDRLPLSIRRNINNTNNDSIRSINNINNNRETIRNSNNMNYNTNNNHGDKSVNLNSFTRRDIIHRENTFVKNELSWNKPKEMFTPKQQHFRYNTDGTNNIHDNNNENVENNKSNLHLNLDLIENPSNKLQNVVGSLIADDNHMVDRISKARAKYFKERGKRIQMENSINKRGHFSPRSPYINRHNNLSSIFRNSNSKPVRSFR